MVLKMCLISTLFLSTLVLCMEHVTISRETLKQYAKCSNLCGKAGRNKEWHIFSRVKNDTPLFQKSKCFQGENLLLGELDFSHLLLPPVLHTHSVSQRLKLEWSGVLRQAAAFHQTFLGGTWHSEGTWHGQTLDSHLRPGEHGAEYGFKMGKCQRKA